VNENDDIFSFQKDNSIGIAIFSILVIGFGAFFAIALHALWPLIPVPLGLFIIFSNPTQYEISASQNTRKLLITRHWVSSQSYEEIPFDDILHIKVNDIVREGFPEYFVEARLKNGNAIRLTEPTGGNSAYKKLIKLSQSLEKFIKNKS
jgi:hypothetical protein